MMKKRCVLEAPGWVRRWAWQAGGWILGPPDYQFSKKTTHHTPQTTRTLSHALRASAVADKEKQKKQLTTHHTPLAIQHALRATARWRISKYVILFMVSY